MAFGKFGSDREERINFDRMRKYRVERAREQLKKAGLGALITWDNSNIRYLTGASLSYTARYKRVSSVILTRDGGPYLYDASSGPPSYMRELMPWLEGRVFSRLTPSDIHTKEDCQKIVREVARVMDEHGVKNKPVGINGTIAGIVLQEAFKDAGINAVYDSRVMGEARKIKSQDEIECMRIACANADAAFASIRDAIRPGVTEWELVGVGTNTLYRLGSEEVPEFVCASGERTNPIKFVPTDRQIRPGDLVYLDICGSSFHGYKTCYYRTFCCGKATAEQKELYEECRAMLYAGMSAVRAGNTALDVVEKWPADPGYWGYEKWEEIPSVAVAHGIGMDAHDTYPEHFNRLLPKAKLKNIVFEENMILAIETWTGKKGGKDGVRIEEQIVVKKDGYDLLSKFPVDELSECWT